MCSNAGTVGLVMGDIFEAARQGNEEEVIQLLDADPALLERENNFGDRPLAVAALSRQPGVVTLLIERGANISATGYEGLTALHYAALKGTEEVLAFLLNKGAHANSRDEYGATPLMSACSNGYLGVVRMLVQHMEGQGLDYQSVAGRTAMHCVTGWGHDELLRCLLLAGADPTITDIEGMTPRASAEVNQHDERIGEGRARCVAVFQVRPLAC
jgi:ankyrin repeat protein